MTDVVTNKVWKVMATVDNYEAANTLKNKLLNYNKAVKIKRGGDGGRIFRVKTWNPPPPVKKNEEKIDKLKNKFKKGKDAKRKKRDGYKKIRAGREES